MSGIDPPPWGEAETKAFDDTKLALIRTSARISRSDYNKDLYLITDKSKFGLRDHQPLTGYFKEKQPIGRHARAIVF
ncbi:hypothetical protein BDC45DRAFT_565644 [Circinella umbellata]|nr:hypothetical protein BDC45DRAFT_565644 [Circinella umbellata]